MKRLVLASAAIAALAFPMVAAARSAEAGGPVAGAEEAHRGDAEIIVTAQRRVQTLQDVPLAVTAVSGEALEQARITSVTDLQTATPGLRVGTANRPATSTSISLRGIGTSGNDPGLEAAVGFSVDGIYRSRSGTGLGDFVDVESVEILRGPQGTLYGKNTTAGVLEVTTRKPKLDTIEGFAEATAGNRDLVRFRGAVNLPFVAEKVGFRMSFGYHKRDGFIKDPLADATYNNRDRFTLASRLRFQLGEDFEALLGVDYAEADESCCQSVRLSNGQANGVTVPYVAFLANRVPAHGNSYPIDPDPFSYETSVNGPVVNTNRDRGVYLRLNAGLGGARLTSISSYRKFTDFTDNDVDFSGADLLNQRIGFNLRVFSQELRLQGEAFGGKLDWLVGGYFSSEKIRYTESISVGVDSNAYFGFLNPALGTLYPARDDNSGTVANQRAKSYAIFTHNIFEIAEGLRLTGGLRWTKENKAAVSNPYFRGPTANLPFAGFVPIGAPSNPYDLDLSDEAFSGTAILDYRWTPDIMTYVSYSRGYKAGGFALGRDGAGPVYSRTAACSASGQVAMIAPGIGTIYQCDVKDPRFRPETVDSFEFGLRSQFFDRRLTFNLTLFHADYTDLQLNTFTGTGFFLSNAGAARIRGVELETGIRIADGVRIGGNLNFLDSDYGRNVPAVLSGEPALSGQPLGGAPRWSGALSASIDRPISANVDFFARPDIYFTNKYFSGTRVGSNGQRLVLPGFTLFGLSAGIRIDDRFEISAFCRNCGNKAYAAAVFPSVAQSGSRDAFLGNPAEYGISLRFDF